jgi:hypothetical protein
VHEKIFRVIFYVGHYFVLQGWALLVDYRLEDDFELSPFSCSEINLEIKSFDSKAAKSKINK